MPLLMAWALAGCTKPISNLSVVPTETLRPLIPYRTLTATLPAPTFTPLDKVPGTPVPSATPFLHIVTRGETMLGIALQYGVTLEALRVANPGVDPQFLSIDAQLVIPLGDELQAQIPNPTPVSLEWSEPICYPTGEGGLWCYLLVDNNLSTAVENISAWIGLYDANGSVFASAVAVGLLNILRPGDAMPLTTYFSPPLSPDLLPRGELLTAVEVPSDDRRYLDWQLSDMTVDVRGDLMNEAWVAGTLQQPAGSARPGQVWIMAVAYDATGQVVGVRKVETGGDLYFQIVLYSLGDVIDHVEVLAEVRP